MLIIIASFFQLIQSQTCFDQEMTKYNLNNDNFIQEGSSNYGDLILIMNNNYYLGERYSKGYYNEVIDLRRNFHLYLTCSYSKDNYKQYQDNFVLTVKILYNKYRFRETILAIELNDKNSQIIIYDYTSWRKTRTINSFSTNIHIIYKASEHKLILYDKYLESSNERITYDIDLSPSENERYGVLSITSTEKIKSHKKPVYNISSSYLCIDDRIIDPSVTLQYNNKEYRPGETIPAIQLDSFEVNVKYNSKYESDFMGKGYIGINSSYIYCYVQSSEAQYDYYCNFPAYNGDYKIIYEISYNIFVFNIDVQSSEIYKLVYEKRSDNDQSFYSQNVLHLKFGALNDGDFDLSEFKYDEYLTFYVSGIDNNGEPTKIRNIEKITESLKASCSSELLLEEDINYSYKIKVKVTKKGNYYINSTFLEYSIHFYVDNLAPSVTYSNCYIENFGNIPYISDEDINYICEFYDEAENPIVIKNIIDKTTLSFICKIHRLNNDALFYPVEEYYNENKYIFTYRTDYNGKYKFEAQFGLNETRMETVKSLQNIFYVTPIPTSLEGSYFFKYDKKEWIHIDNLSNNIFNYYEKNEDDKDSDILFLIDLIDLRNKNKSDKYSDIEQSYYNFDPSEIKGEIAEIHSEFNKSLYFTKELYNDKYYIAAKLNDSKSLMRRTSFEYTVSLVYGKTAELKINYILNKNGNYIVCGKELNISNCIVNTIITNSIGAGSSENVGKIVLRTDSNHLYNYYLDDQSNISYSGECIENKKCEVEVFKNKEIEGIYDIKFNSNFSGDYNITLQINGQDLLEGKNSFSVNVESIAEAYTLERVKEEEESYYTVDEDIKLGFNIKDKYGNPINYNVPSDKFGLSYTLTIDGEEQPISYINIQKDINSYIIKETNTISGEYIIILKTKYSDSEIIFRYYKRPGKADNKNSKLKVTNNNKLYLGDISLAELDLKDSYGNSINNDPEAFNNELKYVEIYALNDNNDRIDYSQSDNNIFKSYYIEKAGSFHVYAKVYGSEIRECDSCNFDVIDSGFDFPLSQLKMIGDSVTLMTEGSVYTLYKGLQRPAFEFDFLTPQGLLTNKIDKNTNIEAKINSTLLDKTWIGSNKLIWTLPESYELIENEKYTIEVINNDIVGKKYYLNIVEFGNDESKEGNIEISKTFVSPHILYLKPGKSDTFFVEFRGNDDLRYKGILDIEQFDYTTSECSDLNVKAKLGNKNGQIIVDVKSNKTIDFSQNCIISMSYNENTIETKVQVIITPDILSYFELDVSNIVRDNILYPGTVGTVTKIKLYPYDSYGNLIKDNIFDNKKYSEESFTNLFNIKHNYSQYKPILTTLANPVSHYIELSISSIKSGKITLSSPYLTETYEMEIQAGEASKYSRGYLNNNNGRDTLAGIQRKFIIEPRDENKNKITNKDIIENIIDKYSVKVFDMDGNTIIDSIEPIYNEEDGVIEYVIENTKSETKYVEAYYNNEIIILEDNIINVVSGEPVFRKTKIIYNEKEYSLNDTLQISLTSFPIIDLQLYDEYGNIINDLSNINEKEFSLFIDNNNLSTFIIFNSYLRLYIEGSKIDKYSKIDKLSNNNYLYVKIGNNTQIINITFVDEVQEQNITDEPTSFIISPDNLLLKAGEEGLISVTIYTEKGKPMGHFFNNSELLVSCSDNNTEIKKLNGKYYGSYDIILSSKIATNDEIICKVKVSNYVRQSVLRIIPDKVSKCKKIDNTLQAKSGNIYQLNFNCFDKYGNNAYLENGIFDARINNNQNEDNLNYDISLNNDNSFSYTINIEPTLIGEYTIKSIYLDEDVKFEVINGEISLENSYAEVNNNANIYAGNEVEIDIHVLDKYNNEVLLNKDNYKGLFDLFYREGQKYGDYRKVSNNPEIIDNGIIRFKQKIFKDCDFRVINTNTSYLIKCSNCEIKVLPSIFNLSNSDVLKFNSFSKTYTKLDKKNDILYNYNENLLIRIYPKDSYENKIKEGNLINSAKIDNCDLVKIDSNEEFIEFKESSGCYSNLSEGEYNLIIDSEGQTTIYNVDISGKSGFDKDTIDPSKTKILLTNLDFIVGEYGYFTFELRNQNNARYAKTFSGAIEINPSDTNINYSIFNEGSSTLLVLVTSTKSNIFPNDGEFNLNLKINGNKVFELELSVNPEELFKATINNNCNQIDTITTDEELQFSIIGYDYYDNKVLINDNEAKLIVKSMKEVPYKYSFINLFNGEHHYIYKLTSTGLYNITSGKNNYMGNNIFFDKKYNLNVIPGKISPEKTIVKFNNNQIKAGEKILVTVYAKDNNNNDVELTEGEILNDFSATFLSNDYERMKVNPNVTQGTSFSYEKKINKKGIYQINIQYNKRKINYNNKLVVNPSTCEPDNTLIYSKNKNGEYKIFTDDTNIYSSLNSPLNIKLVFRDEFNNIINDINEIEIKNSFLYGNDMEELQFTYHSGELYLDLNNATKRNILNNLVTRFGYSCYNFNFTVKYKEKERTFNLNVSHFGKNEDETEFGNGDYDLTKCEIDPMSAKFMVGTSYEVSLTLRTKEGLKYNGEFNPEFINCNEIEPKGADNSFTCKIYKKNRGVYGLIYEASTIKKEDGENIYNVVTLYDSGHNNNRKFKVRLINTSGIPYKEGTNITKSLPEEIKADTEAIIVFTLKDKYGNDIIDDTIIDNLFFENNGIEIASNIQYKNNEFWAKLEPIYPPKNINIQLYYKINDDNKIELFKKLQKSEFKFNVDYTKTVVNSRNIKEMNAGELLDLNLILYDEKMLCYDDKNINIDLLYATVQGPLEKTTEMRTYGFKQHEDGSVCKYIYKIDIYNSSRYEETGTYSIVVYAGDNNHPIAWYTQTVISGDIDKNKFVIYYTEMDDKPYNDENIPAGETIQFTVQAYDQFNNKIDHGPLSSELFIIKINQEKTEMDFNLKCYIGGSGTLNCLFNTTKEGVYDFDYYYNGTLIEPNTQNGPNSIKYIPGPCSAENPNITYPSKKEMDVSTIYIYTIRCFDQYNNSLKKGGDIFTSEISLYIEDSKITENIIPKIKDNQDGTYDISFIPPLPGEYSIYTYLDGKQYGKEIFNLTGKECDKPNHECPNNGNCVSDLRDCIPEDQRCKETENPFKCKDGTCVKSMTDCPVDNAEQCQYMKAAYPPGKEYLCSFVFSIDCRKKFPSYKEECDDGICRISKDYQPNQRVCPIGKILCADLTCADNINQCYNDWPDCIGNQVRCPDQSCVDDQKKCPTTITCPKPSDYVCPDGTCVESEIYCTKLKTCPDETPYLCSDYSCAKKPESCTHTVACGHGKSLCSDLICRETC